MHLGKTWIIFALGIIGLCPCFWGCVASAPPEPGVEKGISAEYAIGIQPLKPHECGRCHPHFHRLRTNGGKHRIDCQRCHVTFHVYRAGRVQYEEIMPKCSACHDLVHGADLAQCSECHSDAHAPLTIPARRALEQGCHVCHPKVDKEMKTYITQHTELYCFSCHHTRHRYVPECMECHQPHTKGMTQAECLTCHPPHKALQVVYPDNIPKEACAGCHRHAYQMLEQNKTKHSALHCIKCHPDEHRAMMQCRNCHPEIHSTADRLHRLPVCGNCHGVAHSLRHD